MTSQFDRKQILHSSVWENQKFLYSIPQTEKCCLTLYEGRISEVTSFIRDSTMDSQRAYKWCIAIIDCWISGLKTTIGRCRLLLRDWNGSKWPERFLEPSDSKHGCYVQAVTLFSEVSSHKTQDITWSGVGTKLQESFTTVWTIGNLMALLLSTLLWVEIFTTAIFKENFHLNNTLLQTVVTYSHVKIVKFENIIIRFG